MKSEIKNAHDLQGAVSAWVDTFNFVQLEVLEKMADDCLFEYIREPKPDYREFMANYSLESLYKEWLEENEATDDPTTLETFCENHENFDGWKDERSNENYPMWNTCFEFKHEESEEVIEAAINAGFGVIEGLEPFSTILFVAGAGYSFYGQHWIPMFLELPWNSDVKETVLELGIKYDNL